jgi:hypothetical protein
MTEARTKRRGPTAARSSACARARVGGLCVALLLLGCGGERGAAVASDTALRAGASAGVASDPVATVPVAPPTPAVDSATPPSSAVDAFIRHVETQRDPGSGGVARGYAAEGLRLLASGIEELAARDTASATDLAPRLATLRARADSLQREPDSLARARVSSEAFVLASDLLQTLQEGAPPALTDRAAEARQAAAAIRPDQPLLTQEPAVRRFFERAAAALRGLTGARTS